MKKLKIGIIGTGYTTGVARSHVDAYNANERTKLTALYDIVPGRSKEWAEGKNIFDVKCCENIEELFDSIEAVSICTPNNTHVDLMLKAIYAGKHFICEKPLSTSYEEGKKAVKISKIHPDIVAMVGFNYRSFPAIKYIKSIIDEGKIGNVYTCRQFLGGGRIADAEKVKLEWRMQEEISGAGALADFGSHMLDLVDYLLSNSQGKIEQVFAMTGTFIKQRNIIDGKEKGLVTNDDSVEFMAKMENGALLSFVASRVGAPGQMMEIIGEGGMLIMNGKIDEVEVWLKDKNGSYKNEDRKLINVPDVFKGEERHKGLINEFVDAIIDKKPTTRTLERGLYIQYLIDTLKRSADEGKPFFVEE